jgi:hypothetical protein
MRYILFWVLFLISHTLSASEISKNTTKESDREIISGSLKSDCKKKRQEVVPCPKKCVDVDMKAAEIAWNYFENNYNMETGLVNG